MKSRRFILGQQNLYSNGEHRRSVVGKVTLMVSMPQTERELKGDDSGVMSHSPPTYVLEFSHARIQLVHTLISTFLS